MLKDWDYDAPENKKYKEIRDDALHNLDQDWYKECTMKAELKAMFDVISIPQVTENEALEAMRKSFAGKEFERLDYLWIEAFMEDFCNTIYNVIEVWYMQTHDEGELLDPDIENWYRDAKVHKQTGRQFITEMSGITFQTRA
ncbi:hypothetical protein HB847_15695 [Listeria booriae]|uniref:Uncharacterized protein n=1 Tax=Listeria booriae TaxID=1552123 RepID=A0A841YA53_9LIST|nr:hypothetical protein [Listeria booriae]MBC1373795.1 hypothetical protein [Listeria booriae]